MKGYKFGVEWIALNDNPGDYNFDDIVTYISTALLADLFGKSTDKVAKDIIKYRIKAYSLSIKEDDYGP